MGTAKIGETSEWRVILEAAKPAWARDEGGGATVPEGSGNKGTHAPSGTEDETGTPVGSPDDALVVVDRRHGLPSGYAPEDLAPLQPLGIPTLRGESMKLRGEAAESVSRMLADARSEGFDLVVCSAYRSHEAQVVSYGRLTAMHGEGAGGFSAPPGHSEHQLGTVVDVSNAKSGYRLDQRFGETEASGWLRRNAAEYGFVLSYPREAEEHTGYRWEPWHYRYIGPENALRYREGGYDSPQQFFRKEGSLPGR